MTTERSLQQQIVKKLDKCGILTYKFASPSRRGVPDLLCIPPGAPAFFIEVKNPKGTGRLSRLQTLTINRIRQQGTHVYVIDNIEDVTIVIDRIRANTGSAGSG